ncbi:MAG: hypothetical protein AMXMBFR58_15890 [Phycisphaerae bacterium]
MWDIESSSELLRDLSAADGSQDILRLILVHARRNSQLERAVVLSREGLAFPLFRVIVDVSYDGQRCGEDPRGLGPVRAGGLLADLLYAGEYRIMSSLPTAGQDPSVDIFTGAGSLIAFPLLDQRAQTGTVVMFSPVPRAYEPHELCGLAIMGALLQRANRADQLAQKLKDACRELDTELAAAASVQRWLLPPPAPPSTGVGTAALYRPAQRSGGDYYDAGPLPDGRFGVMIADVSGHGAAAAVLMAILRTIVHDEVDQSPVSGPAALLDYADGRLCNLGLPNRGAFVTAFSGALDTCTGEFRYSCAGHPPARLLRMSDHSVVSLDGAATPPLGVLEERTPRSEEAVRLSPGDLLVFYSDGITEARSPSREFFGIAGLDGALVQLPPSTTPEAVVAAVEREVSLFSPSNPPLDDQTLMVVQWNGYGPGHTSDALGLRAAKLKR